MQGKNHDIHMLRFFFFFVCVLPFTSKALMESCSVSGWCQRLGSWEADSDMSAIVLGYSWAPHLWQKGKAEALGRGTCGV